MVHKLMDIFWGILGRDSTLISVLSGSISILGIKNGKIYTIHEKKSKNGKSITLTVLSKHWPSLH